MFQIFDDFMENGIWEPTHFRPIITMLAYENDGLEVPVLEQACQVLCHGLRICLLQIGGRTLMSKLSPGFHYAFDSLRGEDVVIKRLNNEPGKT